MSFQIEVRGYTAADPHKQTDWKPLPGHYETRREADIGLRAIKSLGWPVATLDFRIVEAP